ncbi:MAG: helix-turn-helix transcriptional regulator [Oscillospiraceae bacterium]|nr:helix-turn-helix transcriptional regulator [Oscillospiraceae bacterium]
MNEIILSNSSMPVVEECGLIAASESFYHMDRIADFNVLLYVTDGTIHVTEDGTDYAVNTGELMFLKKGLHHWGRREIQKGTRWYFIHFYDGAEYESEFICRTKLPKMISGITESRIEQLIEQYIDLFYSGNEKIPWVSGIRMFELLMEIAYYGAEKNEPKGKSDKICDYLQKHYTEPFSAKVLEKEFFLSYKHMAAVFKKEKNMTMQEYHTNLRMNAACRWLTSTLMSVGEIAAKLGYSDALYFSRKFRESNGMSPSEYRRNKISY